MTENTESNPFKGLIGTPVNINNSSNINTYDQAINGLIENVFLITVRREAQKDKQLVYMEEIASNLETPLWSLDYIDQALFERLLLTTPSEFLIPNTKSELTALVAETQVIQYLYKSFTRNENYRNDNSTIIKDACNKINELIFRNITTAVKQPDLFEGQSLNQQFLDIYQFTNYEDGDEYDRKISFLKLTAKTIYDDDPPTGMGFLKSLFYPIFNDIMKKIQGSSLVTLNKWIITFLRCFGQDKTNPHLAQVILDYTTPNPNSDGIKFGETLFGQLLSLSILPKTHAAPYEYYDNPTEHRSSNMTATLWGYLNTHLEELHLLFKDFLVLGGDVRDHLLTWIGNCIHANAARGQIWNAHSMGPLMGNLKTVSDAFMVNLCGVLLRLCKPLLRPQFKVMIVDPTYCGVPENDRIKKGVHLKGMDKETCLVPTDENEIRLISEKYNFVTECFFMTHKAIDLGYRVCIEKLVRINREIVRLQSAYQDTVEQNGADLASNIFQMLKTQTQQFISLQNTIIEPNTEQFVSQFYEATALWLTQITAKINNEPENGSFAPQSRIDINLPLKNAIPKTLKSIPEFVLENLVNYLTFARNFETHSIDRDPEVQSAVFTMILIFMGAGERVRNPHLRARLAEGLESLLPKSDQQNSFQSNVTSYLFQSHPHRLEIVENLLKVFVGIEMTGQSVQFEQKFNYRRPMYAIMDHLWEIQEQKECFKRLAIEAVQNIEAVNPPIFLRFINLLINDAIFLLDESLSNLQQIRTLQAAQDAGEWNNLPATEQQQNRANLQHLGMMAKFDNILGRDTIRILKLITTEIKGIFCHTTIVERVVSMLNYFLLHLVGPKMGNLKVKDKKEFEFDPGHTVREICSIYVNLEDSEQFCLAISQDGRSYSPKLFDYAEQVLVKIGGGQLIGEMKELSIKVQRLETQQKLDQEALADAPDDYLDPIMSTLMLDPVTLPSSHVILDRATIARHLLSDQTDPFNRSPLTMDQVIPNAKLKDEIHNWMRERREAYSQRTSGEAATN